MKKKWSIIIKLSVIIFAIVGLIATFAANDFMSSSAWLYFTVQSNLWILSIFVVFLILELIEIKTKKDLIPNWLRTIKFMFTSSISLTFLVFLCMLTPQMIITANASYLFSLGNVCVHNLVPILAILDWCLFDYVYKTKKSTFIFGILPPLFYCIFALIASTTTLDFGEGSHFPYFFFDYITNTWFQLGNGKFGIFYWLLILNGIVFTISWVLVLIKNKIAKKQEIISNATDKTQKIIK